MWKLKVFVVLIASLWISGVAESFTIPDEAETEILSQALVRIAKEIIAPINQTVNIVTCNGTGNRLNNLPKYLMKDLNNSMTFTNELKPDLKQMFDYLHGDISASIMICEEWTYPGIEQINLMFMKPKFTSISYVTAERAELYINLIRYKKYLLYPNMLLLVNNGDYIELKVAAFVSESSCEKGHLRTINRFSKRTRQWLKPSFDLIKLRSNNHGCPLKISFSAQSPEVVWPNHEMEGTNSYSKLSGYFIRMINELSRRLNFSIQDNIDVNEADLTINGFSTELACSECKLLKTDMITIYREIIVVIPLGEFYSGFEKLFLPFDVATWILIVMTFTIGLMTILIVTQLSRTIRNFVIGRDVRAPTVNLFGAFFGLGQLRLPGRNFARFLLMLYILWCLIIRTGYQGVLYDLLKGDARKAQNMQLDDYISNNNATVHVNEFCFYTVLQRREFSRFGYI